MNVLATNSTSTTPSAPSLSSVISGLLQLLGILQSLAQILANVFIGVLSLAGVHVDPIYGRIFVVGLTIIIIWKYAGKITTVIGWAFVAALVLLMIGAVTYH